MTFPPNWRNPVVVPAGRIQTNVDPLSLLPSRPTLSQVRLDMQRALLDAGNERYTPIQVTEDGVIWDGHHAIRVAAEQGKKFFAKVVNQKISPVANSIMDLPVE